MTENKILNDVIKAPIETRRGDAVDISKDPISQSD